MSDRSTEKERKIARATVAAFVAMDHLYDGACPDVEQPEERDERCPACTRLTALTGVLPPGRGSDE